MMVCLAYWEFGNPDAALSMANESLRLGKLAGFTASQVLAGGHKASFLGNLGAVDQGLAAACEAVEVAESQFPHFRCHPLGVLVELHLLAENLDEAVALVEQSKSDLYREAHPTWNMRINIAEVELALKQNDYERAIEITDLWLPKLRQNNLRLYSPTMLQFKSKALLALGQTEAARECLLEAQAIAEMIGARATLWPILFALSHLETNPAIAQQLHQQAQGIVESIAEHIGPSDMRNSFLNLSTVRDLFS
jgi:tetratricopeptide (TPR) repeat protein